MIASVGLCGIFFLSAIPSVLTENIALIIIDVQNCFLPGGSLAVENGQEVIPVINTLRTDYEDTFRLVVLSQDWHCSDHISFASQHTGFNAYQEVTLLYSENGTLCEPVSACQSVAYNVTQMLWPDHCVINSTSAEFDDRLIQKDSDVIIRKGYNCKVDSYSAFFDNGQFSQTGLNQILQDANISTVFVTGLALDYCVYYTSSDSKRLGYKTYLVEDASRGVASDTSEAAMADMKSKGINIIQSKEVGAILESFINSAFSIRSSFGTVVSVAMAIHFLQAFISHSILQ
ncbi:nicotinamidase-like [Ylistrum balloti]|uniref:nicotinamidase-like n=1 Tax=Ylistrum balloti TaxID=509963 RepID=UPI002905F4F2|nr:nicotinamidase-like [Ylistrum balloti]